MKKRTAILGVVLLLSFASGCAMTEAKDVYGEKSRMSLSQQISKCNTEKVALAVAAGGVAKVFDAEQDSLQGEASYHLDSNIQPDGWFVQLYADDWDYAVWIAEDKNRIKLTRASEEHPIVSISNQEMKQIIQSEEILDAAKEIVADKLGDERAVKEAYFDNTDETSAYHSVDVTLIMEDGHSYMLSFYKDGLLRSLLYLE